MSTPTIRAALERLVALSKQHAIASVWDGAFFNARAALKAAALGDGLAPRVLAMCKQRKWSLHWTSRGAYLRLEASELIEALRGKRGDPLAEAADVLLVLMSITENAGIDWSAVVQRTAATCSRLEACDQYPGEERMDSLTAPPAPEMGEVGELVDRLGWIADELGDTGWSDDSASVARAATLLQQLAAPAPVVVPVAEDLQHLIRFMCRTWVAIDEWASMFSEAMDTYPMIQSTRNQMNLREIAAQSYDKKRVALGVQLMLSAHDIPLPQGGEGES